MDLHLSTEHPRRRARGGSWTCPDIRSPRLHPRARAARNPRPRAAPPARPRAPGWRS